jgi:tetratricopeptide (TPR) repeat protein
MGVLSVSCRVFLGIALSSILLASPGFASPQSKGASASGPGVSSGGLTTTELVLSGAFGGGSVEVNVTGPDGQAVQGQVLVTLSKVDGRVVNQIAAKGGSITFHGVSQSEYRISVTAIKYQTATRTINVNSNAPVKVTVALEALSVEDAADSERFYALPAKIQKDIGKALAALRANRPNDALHPLLAAQKKVPNNAEIEYLFGLYSSQLKNDADAHAHWIKTLELNPTHLSALLSVSNDLIQQKKGEEAEPYVRRALETEPASWRAHVLLAEALLLQKQADEAVQESQRAIDLGHERAATAQVVLAQALAQRGDRDQAIQTLKAYAKTHPSDTDAAQALAALDDPAATNSASSDAALLNLHHAAADAAALPMAVNWRPADVDDHVPATDTASPCALNDVVAKAGQQLYELISDVDKFSATESLVHESIDKWGVVSLPEKRKFDYVVSIQELQHRYLDVEEFRSGAGSSPVDFPDGVVTRGLPAMVLIFHPINAPDFDMSCEGLARLSTGLAWQVHFRQRPDKPNVIKGYRVGAGGPSYPVGLRGRAWISAGTYQIVRMETDLVTPVPEIHLVSDHTEIEYGPVQFQNGKVNMWLPQSADIYYDWRGKRAHRRHSFNHYLLFSVDEKQKISVPKIPDATADNAPPAPTEKP